MNVAIRRLGPKDLAEMRELNVFFGKAFDEEPEYSSAPPDDAYCLDLLGRDDVILLSARIGNEIVGGVGAYVLRKFEQKRSEIFLYDLAVAADHRRHGIATILVDHLRELAREIGAWMIYLNTEPDNEARHFYQSLGSEPEEAIIFDIAP